MTDSTLFWFVQGLNLYVGILWLLGGLAVALTLDWSRLGRVSIFTIGFSTSLLWLTSVGYNLEIGFIGTMFRYQAQSIIITLFLALGMTSLVTGLLVGLKHRGIGR